MAAWRSSSNMRKTCPPLSMRCCTCPSCPRFASASAEPTPCVAKATVPVSDARSFLDAHLPSLFSLTRVCTAVTLRALQASKTCGCRIPYFQEVLPADLRALATTCCFPAAGDFRERPRVGCDGFGSGSAIEELALTGGG